MVNPYMFTEQAGWQTDWFYHNCTRETLLAAIIIVDWAVYPLSYMICIFHSLTMSYMMYSFVELSSDIWYIFWNHLGTAVAPAMLQYIPGNMHTVFALLCFVVVIHWVIFPYPSGLLHWHCGNLTIAPVPAKQPWWIWVNTSCEFIMNDCITTTKQSTAKPCSYFLGYTVYTTGAYFINNR